MFYDIMNSLAVISLGVGIFFNIRSHFNFGEDVMGSAIMAFLGYGSAVACLTLEAIVYGLSKLF